MSLEKNSFHFCLCCFVIFTKTEQLAASSCKNVISLLSLTCCWSQTFQHFNSLFKFLVD